MDIKKFLKPRFDRSVKTYKETKKKYPLEVYMQYRDIIISYLFSLVEYKKKILENELATSKQRVEANKFLDYMKKKLDQLFETEIIDLLRNEKVFSKLLRAFHGELMYLVKKNYNHHVLQFYGYLIILVDFINAIYVSDSASDSGVKLSISDRLVLFKETLVNQTPYVYIRPIEGNDLTIEEQLVEIQDRIISGIQSKIKSNQLLLNMMVDENNNKVYGFGGELAHLNDIFDGLTVKYKPY